MYVVTGPFQWPAPQSGSLSRILSGTRPSVQTVSDVCLSRRPTCLLDALSALEVLWRLLRYINLLTYLLTYLLTCVASLDARSPISRGLMGPNAPALEFFWPPYVIGGVIIFFPVVSSFMAALHSRMRTLLYSFVLFPSSFLLA